VSNSDGSSRPAQGLLERLRLTELEKTRPWLRPGSSVLEIGGGSGFQARLLSARGCQVASVDVDADGTHVGREYPVQIYDGTHLPFATASFDAVFSSNVLEHVRALPELLEEIRRVLKPQGIAVHILPTPVWRLWTCFTHYPFLVKYALGRGLPASAAPRASTRPKNYARMAMRAIIPAPHGEYSNALAELWYFSRARWRRVFTASGMLLIHDEPTNLFYTGYSLFPHLAIERRIDLARLLGSSCRIYVMSNDNKAL
jgi:SAM-dependent methyltransferase